MKTIIRSKKHLAYIRTLPCLACRAPAPSQAAHIRTGTNGGTGMKPGDNYTIPLCADCHRKQHQVGERSFWADIFGHRCGVDIVTGYAGYFWLHGPVNLRTKYRAYATQSESNEAAR